MEPIRIPVVFEIRIETTGGEAQNLSFSRLTKPPSTLLEIARSVNPMGIPSRKVGPLRNHGKRRPYSDEDDKMIIDHMYDWGAKEVADRQKRTKTAVFSRATSLRHQGLMPQPSEDSRKTDASFKKLEEKQKNEKMAEETRMKDSGFDVPSVEEKEYYRNLKGEKLEEDKQEPKEETPTA